MFIVVLLFLIFVSVGFYIYIGIKYRKYKNIKLKSKMSGFEVARSIIDNFDLNNVYITETRTDLVSKYDSNRKVIKLTKNVFNEESITSCAIASFEAAHAIQDKKKDKMFNVKRTLAPIATIILILGYILTIIGCLFGHVNTITIGLCLIVFILLFQVAFYKVEKTALRIATVNLINNKIITSNESKKIEELLQASSYMCIASIVFPVMEVIKKVIEFGNSNN